MVVLFCYMIKSIAYTFYASDLISRGLLAWSHMPAPV